MAKNKVELIDSKTVSIDLSDFGDITGGSLAYIWRETPVKARFLYSKWTFMKYIKVLFTKPFSPHQNHYFWAHGQLTCPNDLLTLKTYQLRHRNLTPAPGEVNCPSAIL